MAEARVRGAVALIAGNLSCIGIVLVYPFSASIAGLWGGRTAEHPAHAYLAPAVGFGILLAGCLALAVTSLAFRAERPGSAAPALVALTLIGFQLVIFLGMAAFSSMTAGALVGG
jgi:hypothetical protein